MNTKDRGLSNSTLILQMNTNGNFRAVFNYLFIKAIDMDVNRVCDAPLIHHFNTGLIKQMDTK